MQPNLKKSVAGRQSLGTLRYLSLRFQDGSSNSYRLAGLVVKASTSGAEDPGSESRLRRDFSGSSHTSDLKIGSPVATLPGAWC